MIAPRVAAIVLAAGASSRMGITKQLLGWQGQSLIEHCISTALEAQIDPVITVTGHDRGAIEKTIEHLPTIIVNNIDWATGQSTSLRAGLKHLPPGIEWTFFLLADQPFINSHLLTTMIRRSLTSNKSIIAPLVLGDKRSNPVLFNRSTFEDLDKLTGDSGGRGIFTFHQLDLIDWLDTTIDLDIDTLSDYKVVLGENNATRCTSKNI